MSFTVALNSREDGDFEGGGTWFEALGPQGLVVDAEVGRAVAFAGALRHAGYPIRAGTRVILVLFLFVEGFAYGGLCSEYEATHGVCAAAARGAGGGDGGSSGDTPTVKPSGDAPDGYVVYKQTKELVALLNLGAASVLD